MLFLPQLQWLYHIEQDKMQMLYCSKLPVFFDKVVFYIHHYSKNRLQPTLTQSFLRFYGMRKIRIDEKDEVCFGNHSIQEL